MYRSFRDSILCEDFNQQVVLLSLMIFDSITEVHASSHVIVGHLKVAIAILKQTTNDSANCIYLR
jgi:hypothetical protein